MKNWWINKFFYIFDDSDDVSFFLEGLIFMFYILFIFIYFKRVWGIIWWYILVSYLGNFIMIFFRILDICCFLFFYLKYFIKIKNKVLLCGTYFVFIYVNFVILKWF